jgi:uncharacterized membrane protein YoaK (UPF0700 family)
MRDGMRDTLLLALTAAAGWTDALSYAALDHVFTANMTGNLVLLGLALGSVQPGGAARSAVALGGFAAGALLASAMTRDVAGEWPDRITAALVVEAAALVAFAALWSRGTRHEWLIALSAVGMGIQSAAVRRLAVAGVATTFVTGTLTSLMAGLAALRPAGGWGRLAAVLAALLAGATVGAAAWSRWPGVAAAGPAALVAAVTIVAAASRVRP